MTSTGLAERKVYYSEGENFCFEYGDWREAFLRRFKRYLNGLNGDRQFRTRGILETVFLIFGRKEQIGVATFLEGARRATTIPVTASRYREEHVDVNNGHKNALGIRRVLRWCRTIIGF